MTTALWPLIEQYRPDDVQRLRPLLARYEADELAQELWGHDAEEVAVLSPLSLRRDWRAVARTRQFVRLHTRRIYRPGLSDDTEPVEPVAPSYVGARPTMSDAELAEWVRTQSRPGSAELEQLRAITRLHDAQIEAGVLQVRAVAS